MKCVKIYDRLPDSAREIRTAVFTQEQGFTEEFDEKDGVSVHLVMFDGDTPIGTCRVFPKGETGEYFLGRLAVIRAYRGQGIGGGLVKAAEEYVRGTRGTGILLHAQCAAEAFYEKCGYISFGEVDDEEGCPHVWMRKDLS